MKIYVRPTYQYPNLNEVAHRGPLKLAPSKSIFEQPVKILSYSDLPCLKVKNTNRIPY